MTLCSVRARHKATVCDPVTGDAQDRSPEMERGPVGARLGGTGLLMGTGFLLE